MLGLFLLLLSRVDSLAVSLGVRSQLGLQYLSVIVGLRWGPRRQPGAGAYRAVRARLGLGPPAAKDPLEIR